MMEHETQVHQPRTHQAKTLNWLPHPLMTLLLILIWVLLQNSLSLGNVVLGVFLGVLFPLLTSGFWPDRPRVRNYRKAVGYFLIVMGDIVVANIEVARLIVFAKVSSLRPRWISVPLALTQPEAITLLAGTVTMTPGTVSCDLSADGRHLLVHCLDEPDPDAAVQRIKTRYEARLLEIFE